MEYCNCHGQQKNEIAHCAKDIHDIISPGGRLDKIWEEINGKVPIWLFVVLAGVILGNAAFQWKTYERIGSIDNKIAVIENQVNDIRNSHIALQYDPLKAGAGR